MKRILILMLLGILVFGPGKAGIAQQSKQKAEQQVQQQEKDRQESEEKARQEEMAKREKEIRDRKEFIEQERMEALAEHERALAEQMQMLEDYKIDIDFEDLDLPPSVIVTRDHMPAMAGNDFFIYGPGGQESQTQLTLRNTFRGGSDSSQGNFEVGDGTRRFRCMINGKVRSGEIKISIRYPDGKVFKDLTINSTAEISFSQSVSIQEGKGDKYMGTWKYEVEAVKAEGNYMLQISTQ